MEEDDKVEETIADGSRKDKKNRERKKHVLSALQKQIEFYFGDANLRHDRFLRRAIQNEADGYIAIKVIADFNKMKQISDDLNLIVKAMKNSNLLQVNEDESKVKRKLPLPEQANTDAQTVYVERLPPYADQEWLREVFSCCGSIDYISLPRYKNTREIKGFAFIEYSSAEAAEKACQVLNSIHSRINNTPLKSTLNSQKKDSTSKEKSMKRKRRQSASFSEHDGEDKVKNCDEEKLSHQKKRRRCLSESSSFSHNFQSEFRSKDDTNNCEEKRIYADCSMKTAENDNQIIVKLTETETETEKDQLAKNNEDSENHTVILGDNHDSAVTQSTLSDFSEIKCENCDEKSIDIDKKQNKKEKKKRKRNKKVKEEKVLDIPHLSVITKKEWLRLKEMYKMLQRGDTKSLKMEIKKDRCGTKLNNMKSQHANTQCQVITTQDTTTFTESDASCIKPLSIPVVGGTIVQVNALDLNGELLKQNIKKELLASHVSIAYLDLKDGESQGFIRLSSQQDAQTLMTIYGDKNQPFSFDLKKLSEVEEDSYHKKIEEDRKKKFSTKQSKKERGKDKVKINKKVQNVMNKSSEMKREHIRFD